MHMMNVVMIGSGNVATALCLLLKKNNIPIRQIISRNKLHAEQLAEQVQCAYSDFNGKIDDNADVYMMALSDDAYFSDFSFLTTHDKPIVHTAGALSKDVLRHLSKNYGVMYPLQTFSKHIQPHSTIPFLIDANNTDTLNTIKSLAYMLSEDVKVANDDERIKMHVAAVFVNNFTNHLYKIAEDFCQKEQLDFRLLYPLIQETAHKITHSNPTLTQTGPARRKDMNTINVHLNLLNAYPPWKEIYEKLTESILKETSNQ
jgi:predicted short-subunit dehydrogenase-like oxidoreductase (DUF2520 family)